MGKSLVSSWLQEMGLRVVDTDVLARELTDRGQVALGEIQRKFGDEVMNRDGTLERRKLAERIFRDPDGRRKLEEILHPRIRSRWQERLLEWQNEGVAEAVVVIPLLYETGAEKFLDKVVCMGCSEKTQIERLRARGWSKEEITLRNQAQLPLAQKMDRADYVVWNESSAEVAQMQARRIFGRGEAETGTKTKRKD
jgi:dephospho-CoA kinase